MQLNPYLSFNGQCKAAFKFYEQCLRGEIVAMITYGESPMAKQSSPEWQDKIMHARMIVAGETLMGSDSPPEHYQETKGMFVALGIESPEEAERIFRALAENGNIQMPIQETFWALRFGMLVDRFGTPWMINCERPNQESAG